MQSGWKFTLGLSAVLMMLGGCSEQQETPAQSTGLKPPWKWP